jgi:hypothetical protein
MVVLVLFSCLIVLREGVWCSVGNNNLVRFMSRCMTKRIVNSKVDFKCLDYLRDKGGDKFVDRLE